MRRLLVSASLFALSLAPAAYGQQIVHALSGKVTAIYPGAVKIATDDGSGDLFEVVKPDAQLDFQKNVKALTIPAASFKDKDAQVVVFYVGDDNVRTTVAFEDLGTAPLVKSAGTLVKLDKHAHTVTIKDDSGAEKSFSIDEKTVGDGTSGAALAEKLSLSKGEKVRIVSANNKAVFIRAMSL